MQMLDKEKKQNTKNAQTTYRVLSHIPKETYHNQVLIQTLMLLFVNIKSLDQSSKFTKNLQGLHKVFAVRRNWLEGRFSPLLTAMTVAA